MDFLKRLFGGGGQNLRDGLYFYIQPRGCDEVVRVRINMMNDPSLDESGGYFVHKTVMGVKCFQRAELTLTFDRNRKLINKEVSGGVLVDESDYDAWVAAQNPEAGAPL
ncbi:MAG: hypothetical protein JNL42_00245 [Anaerolineae bacterium]|nr:hypothetical protein [Anaerolineae bacterium]